jgi:hypothetical protein
MVAKSTDVETAPDATGLQAELINFLGEKRNLVDAIRDLRRGVPAKAIAREVAAAFGRDQVTQFLAALGLHDAARNVLKAVGLDAVTAVRFTGIETPREALVGLGADLVEIADLDTVATRVRSALRDILITVDLPDGEHDEVTDEFVDELFLDGQEVRLVRLKARV